MKQYIFKIVVPSDGVIKRVADLELGAVIPIDGYPARKTTRDHYFSTWGEDVPLGYVPFVAPANEPGKTEWWLMKGETEVVFIAPAASVMKQIFGEEPD